MTLKENEEGYVFTVKPVKSDAEAETSQDTKETEDVSLDITGTNSYSNIKNRPFFYCKIVIVI